MGLKICPLASGSSGNSIYIGHGKKGFLVDCGLSGRSIERRLQILGLSPDDISGIIITHEHQDHIKGAGILSRRWSLPVYTMPGTWAAGCRELNSVPPDLQRDLSGGFSLGAMDIAHFPLSHDAQEPVGLVISWKKRRVVIATDLGETNTEHEKIMEGANVIILEANHDRDMLANGPYPWYLKKRIKSPLGHLSNDDCGNFLSQILNDHPTAVFLAHLSQENNYPELARITVENLLKEKGVYPAPNLHLNVIERNCVSQPYELT